MFKLCFISALALTTITLVSVGCGESDDGADSAGGATALAQNKDGPPSKAKFVEEAEEVCYESKRTRNFEARKYNRAHSKELAKLAPIPAYEKVVVAIVLPSVLKEARDLAGLEVPTGDQEKINAIVAGMKAGVKKAEKAPYSISLESPVEYPFGEVGELMSAYGLIECRNVA